MKSINHQQLKNQIKLAYEKRVPLYIHGTMGIGKSTVVKDFADENKINFVDIRISQLDSVDLRGLPKIDNGTTKWLPPNWLPSDKDSKGILFFDEINLAPPSVQASCFVEDTIISGENFRQIKDIQLDDNVLGIDGYLNKVYDIKKRTYKGELFTIKGRNFMPIKATIDHPFLVIDKYRKPNKKHKVNGIVTQQRWAIVKNLKVGQYVGISIPQVKNSCDKIYLEEKGNYSSFLKLDNNLARFLGYYVGDGYYSNSRIGICLNKTEVEYQEEVKELIHEIFGVNFSYKKYSKKDTCTDIGFYNNEIGNMLKKICGKNVYHKQIPLCILYNQNLDLLKNFLIGYFKADGHILNKNNNKEFFGFTTVSKILALQLQLAFTRFKVLCSIYTQNEKDIKIQDKLVHCKESYKIQSSQDKAFDILDLKKTKRTKRITEHFFEYDNKLWAKIDKITKENFEGDVYNLEVENTHSYLANNYIVHNCYQLILDRKLGDYSLPENFVIISAGNRLEDKANVFDLPTPLANRFTHIELSIPTVEDWTTWALKNKIDSRILAFLNFKPSRLFSFDGKIKEKAFATPRTWAFCSKLIDGLDDEEMLSITVASAVGEAISIEFMAFLKLQRKIDIEEILKNPESVKNITEIDLKYSLLSTITEYYKKKKTVDVLSKIGLICKHLQVEFAVILFRMVRAIDYSFFDIRARKSGIIDLLNSDFRKYLLD